MCSYLICSTCAMKSQICLLFENKMGSGRSIIRGVGNVMKTAHLVRFLRCSNYYGYTVFGHVAFVYEKMRECRMSIGYISVP